MSQMLVEDNVAKSFKALKGPRPIFDKSGRILCYFQPGEVAPPGVAAALSPISDDELQEIRKDKSGGRTTSEVLKRLGAK
jgi:hypothetical protein